MHQDSARKKLEIPYNKKVLINVAGLYPYKGQKFLIEAVKHVIKSRNDVLCFIIGGGLLKNELKRQIKELGLQNHVKLLGFVPDEELNYWMNAADLFVLPSLSEGDPTVMFGPRELVCLLLELAYQR